MIPSDHFVLFYNEIFKNIARRGTKELDRYYQRVADRQANFTLDAFRREGLKGVRDYYRRIRVEENCDLDIVERPDCLCLKMNRCPSLSKALESDAGACPVYCDHCPGWCLRVLAAAGIWDVYDMVSRTEPVCVEWYYTDRDLARKKYEELVALRGGTDLVKTNIFTTPPFLANKVSDSARFEWMHPNLKAAFGFLRTTDLASLPDGRVEIDGERVHANVFTVGLEPFKSECSCEAHRRWIDIHAVISGRETFGTRTATETDLANAYDPKTDCTFFTGRVEPLTLKAGEFAMFFPPSGGHAAGLTLEKNAEKCRRVTVKVRFD